jgi:hypothetical protein
MGGSSKLDKLKAMQKEGKKGIVVDKTFGLKNKNKSKKVQQFCKQVQETQNKNKGIDAESKKKKKMTKLAKLQQEMELKALFSEGLSITVKKKDLHKKKVQQGGGGGGGAGDYYDENWVPGRRPAVLRCLHAIDATRVHLTMKWVVSFSILRPFGPSRDTVHLHAIDSLRTQAEAELAKAQQGATELTLEQRIEKKRQELRDRGVKGTPVTPETFKAWKEKKAKRLLAEKMALQKAETLKKKGKSVLTGRDLYLVQKDVFVDDADAAGDYTRQVEKEEGDELYDENGALIEDAERPAVSVDGVKVDAALYGDDDDLDDLDDLDDD